MAVLQPQKVIHDSSHLWPMRSENKFLRILSLGPANSQPTVRRSDLALLTIRKLASQSRLLGSCTASSRLSATRKLCPLAELSANRRSDPETALWEMSNDQSSTVYRSRSPQQIDLRADTPEEQIYHIPHKTAPKPPMLRSNHDSRSRFSPHASTSPSMTSNPT